MLNKVQIIGNLGRDPEIKTVGSGKVANFSVAVTEKWKDKNGEKKEATEWVNVAVWQEGLIGVIERYVKKGSRVYIEGKMKTRKYEKDGVTHYATDVVLSGFGGQLILLGDPKGDAHEPSNTGGGGTSAPAADLDDDDPIPF